ncbi:MAG: pyridoxamine kinase [Ruminococcus sp.]|nr:pyridoxamine kinase [Ruminococcus sp.]
MSYKRILTIQDISCVGQCSITVALPIISACAHETCILPSAVLSTHTGGSFSGFTFNDLSEDFPKIKEHWLKQCISFDAIYTGYLGTAKQIDYVCDIFGSLKRDGGKIIVDPAMADNGVLYTGFDDEYVEGMRYLCSKADIILPNITEACLMTETPYKESYGKEYINGLVSKLADICSGTVILTGVSYNDREVNVVIAENGEQKNYTHRKILKSYHGTGDVFSSSFVGAFMHGLGVFDAVKIASDYTVECIENTIDDEAHWYGTKFETAIPSLIRMLEL